MISALCPYPSDLSDQEWKVLAPLIPPAKPGGRPRKWPIHKILNAVFYDVRTGCQWRLLPHDFPPWSTVHHYFRLWRLDGTWEKINAVLRERSALVRVAIPNRVPESWIPWQQYGSKEGTVNREPRHVARAGKVVTACVSKISIRCPQWRKDH